MFIRHRSELDEFIAGDNTILREFIHPDKQELELRYSLAHAVVKPGDSTVPHRLTVSEVYCLLEGEGLVRIDDESQKVRKGHVVYIPPHAVQHIENVGDSDLEFFCIVDPAWRPEYEEVL